MFIACGPEKFRYAQDDFVLDHSGKAINSVTIFVTLKWRLRFLTWCMLSGLVVEERINEELIYLGHHLLSLLELISLN